MQILSTTDYSLFSAINGNRRVSKSRVEEMKKSIQKSNKLHVNPIIVNKRMQIVDGQHRWAAAKDLGVVLYYIVDECSVVNDLVTLNSTRANWCLRDYVKFYADQGLEDYIFVEHIFAVAEKYVQKPTVIFQTLGLLSQSGGGGKLSASIRNGTLKVENRVMTECFITVSFPRIVEINRLTYDNNKKVGRNLFFTKGYYYSLLHCYRVMNAVQYDELWSCLMRDYTRFMPTINVYVAMNLIEQSYNRRKSSLRFDFGKIEEAKYAKSKIDTEDLFDHHFLD